MSERIGFAVFSPTTGKYVQHPTGSGIGWSRSREEAEEVARTWGFDGAVVDAEDFAAHWYTYVQTAALGGVMPMETARKFLPPEALQ